MDHRLERLQEEIGRHGANAMVLNPGPTMLYLTGHDFDSHERLFLLLIPRDGEPVAVVPAIEESNWRHAMPEMRGVHLWDDADGRPRVRAAPVASRTRRAAQRCRQPRAQ